jgi:hypothetical protein
VRSVERIGHSAAQLAGPERARALDARSWRPLALAWEKGGRDPVGMAVEAPTGGLPAPTSRSRNWAFSACRTASRAVLCPHQVLGIALIGSNILSPGVVKERALATLPGT